MATQLPRTFYDRPTLEVAPDMLGKTLVRRTGSALLTGRIIEVEAYLGPEDLASHAARRTSKRARIMFEQPGIIYIYLVYGMHHCLNFVTEHDGIAGAVLIRAVEPLSGITAMRLNRGPTISDDALANGPGKLCQAMAIDLTHNRTDACAHEIWIEHTDDRAGLIKQAPRIGVDYAGEWAQKPYRFFIEED